MDFCVDFRFEVEYDKYTMHFNKKDLLSVPNILTYFRFLLVPAFIILYLNADTFLENLLAVACVAASAATDILDGKIARKTNQITDIGKILDPVADKAMEAAMMFCIMVKYPSVIILIVTFGLKELISLCFSGYLFKNKKNIGGAMWCGKVCTVVLYIIMFIFLLIPNLSGTAVAIMIIIGAAVMIMAFVVYMHAYMNLLRELRKERKEAEEI